MPACRNVSFTPAATPLCSFGTVPSATAVSAGLKSPVPISATIAPGRMIVHDEPTPASVNSTIPAATSISPPDTISRADTFAPRALVAALTNSIVIVPGRYVSPASIADRPRICCR